MGPNHPLIDLIHKKTKIKKVDILDMLKALPGCMAEAFFMANPAENEAVEVGGISLRWKKAGKWGSCIKSGLSAALKKQLLDKKIEKKHALAESLYKLMHPKNRETALKKRGLPIHNNEQ